MLTTMMNTKQVTPGHFRNLLAAGRGPMPADTVSISFDAVDSMIAAPAGLLRGPAVMAAANVILDALKAKQTPKHEVIDGRDLAAHWRAECVEDTVAALKAELDNLPRERRFATMLHMFGAAPQTPKNTSDSERHALAALAEAGIANPSTALLRARLMLDHAKEARDLAHGWPDMLGVHGQTDLISALDCAETIAMAAYRHLLTKEKLNAR